MPIEIMELTVRAKVRDEDNRNSSQPAERSTSSAGDDQENSAIAELRRVTEIASEIFKRQKER